MLLHACRAGAQALYIVRAAVVLTHTCVRVCVSLSTAVDGRRSTLLHLAAEIGDMMIVSQLLSHNANVNQADRYGESTSDS